MLHCYTWKGQRPIVHILHTSQTLCHRILSEARIQTFPCRWMDTKKAVRNLQHAFGSRKDTIGNSRQVPVFVPFNKVSNGLTLWKDRECPCHFLSLKFEWFQSGPRRKAITTVFVIRDQPISGWSNDASAIQLMKFKINSKIDLSADNINCNLFTVVSKQRCKNFIKQ